MLPKLGRLAVLFVALFAAACADVPTAPMGKGAGSARSSGNYILEPIVVVGTPKCDPYLDLNWCQGDGGGDCMTSAAGGPSSPDAMTLSGCPGSGGGGGGGSLPSPTDPDPAVCIPDKNPDCLQPLSIWDKETIRQAFSRHLRTSFTDPAAAQKCNQLATRFNQMLAEGRVYRGAFGSTGEPTDPLHVAAYDRLKRTIHFEPDALAAANGGDAAAVRNILNSALHEAAHSLNLNHTSPLWMGSYDLYSESPFDLLSPGANSCITNW